MSAMRTILTSTAMVAMVGAGFGMWSIMSTGDGRQRDTTKNNSQNLPEIDPTRMDETRQRNAMLMEILKDAAGTKDNLARGFEGPAK
ncbi:ubiquinol-cytochrome-c reductase complex assembly factor 3 [Stegastes partitus]|uniref:Ubiquinol-cytochrome-c reductase complex assembly factor 3 n=1 Tax=Stegastes partitus TaxID=144197 RepID=A0A3B5AXD5_9TELE|nr:PREDICTED: UPF0723 protein C11orf83 homolog [Stegastes partitus]